MRSRVFPIACGFVAALVFGCDKSGPAAEVPCAETPAGPVETTVEVEDEDLGESWVAEHYDKRAVSIEMRDGVSLYTVIYRPKSAGPETELPVLMQRTPYSVGPYPDGRFKSSVGPNEEMMRSERYMFVYQDVRGQFMSEGTFRNMTPHVSTGRETGEARKKAIDESTDTYDTVQWMVDNLEGFNGRVGQWGISYPGFYSAAGMIHHHDALVAVSPQAPIADWWYDDFHHHGAFFLPHFFNFFTRFGRFPEGQHTDWPERFDHGTEDGYAWFLDLGPLTNVNERHYHGEIEFWQHTIEHPNRDEFWEARDLLPHLEDVAPAVLTVGGWFDAEDLYGPLQIYRSVEAKNPDVWNALVMGPWRHGGWARSDGSSLGNIDFGSNTSQWYQDNIETKFFEHYLHGDVGKPVDLPEATVFETGRNQWRSFDQWPPATEQTSLYFGPQGALVDAPPVEVRAFDSYVSDPAHPVPFTEEVAIGMTQEYMTDDQRFAGRRSDVLVYQTEVLSEPVTLAGPITAKLWVSTSADDADFVVKLIDVFPGDAKSEIELPKGRSLSGYQMMVRSEVIRGRFRDDPGAPKPFPNNRPVEIELPLQDVLHTFEPGHRLMVQVQSTWFPLIDRNPQRWVDNIFEARQSDFVPATIRVFRDRVHPTAIEFGTIR